MRGTFRRGIGVFIGIHIGLPKIGGTFSRGYRGYIAVL